jgi:hypothetical protein
MTRGLIASGLVIALATTALAAAKYYVIVDPVGNCAVVDSKPGAGAGMKVLGNKDGYPSKDAADKALKDSSKGTCKGVVE